MTGASGIHNDDAGIFVTCDKGQEVKCLREMDDILSEVPLFNHQFEVRRTECSASTFTRILKLSPMKPQRKPQVVAATSKRI